AAHDAVRPAALLSNTDSRTEVSSYLRARVALRPFEPWLEGDALWLLLLHEEARNAVREFIAAWSSLAEAASKATDAAGFIEMVQVLETVQGPIEADVPAWIVLGPFHPFRLDPLLRAADQAVVRLNGLNGVAHLGHALQWTLDRCFPAYPT